MFNKAKLILNNPSIRKKLLFTFLILFIYKIFTWIPIPLLDTTGLTAAIENSDFFVFLNTFSGGALGRFSIMALGISPYITASIVIQILQMDIVPLFKEWGEQGEIGKKKINKVTRYAGLTLAFFNALALILGLSPGLGTELVIGVLPSPLVYIYMALVVTGGTAIILWLADQITQRGAGNGSSMIIAAGILTSIPAMMTLLWDQFVNRGTGAGDTVRYIIIMTLFIAVIFGVTYMQIATRKIPVQYANRQGKSDSNIPIKLNTAGVIPVIFAATLLSVPMTIIGMTTGGQANAGSSGLIYWLDQIFNYVNPIGMIVYVGLIFLFTLFYAFLQINPEKIADKLAKENSYIPGVRPGADTTDFIARVLFKVTMIGATYLSVLALIPIILSRIFNLPPQVTIGGTALLIIVGVAVETTKQIENDANEKTYQGFIN